LLTLLLLRQPRCELLGVTTATGDVVKRAGLVEAVCRAAGRTDVPIHAGIAGPLLHGTEQGVPQYAAIENNRHRTDYRVGAALGQPWPWKARQSPSVLTQQHQLLLRRGGRAKQQHAQLDGGARAAEPKVDGEQLALDPPECLAGQVLEHHDACGRRLDMRQYWQRCYRAALLAHRSEAEAVEGTKRLPRIPVLPTAQKRQM